MGSSPYISDPKIPNSLLSSYIDILILSGYVSFPIPLRVSHL